MRGKSLWRFLLIGQYTVNTISKKNMSVPAVRCVSRQKYHWQSENQRNLGPNASNQCVCIQWHASIFFAWQIVQHYKTACSRVEHIFLKWRWCVKGSHRLDGNHMFDARKSSRCTVRRVFSYQNLHKPFQFIRNFVRARKYIFHGRKLMHVMGDECIDLNKPWIISVYRYTHWNHVVVGEGAGIGMSALVILMQGCLSMHDSDSVAISVGH